MPNSDSRNIQFELIGKSIKLRVFTPEHINHDYIDWLNDSEVVKYSNQRFKHHNTISCHEYLESFENTKNLFLAIHLIDSNKFIGTMTAYFSIPHKVVDIGLMIGDKSIWGKGIGREAWEMLMIYMLDTKNIRKVTGGTLSCNLGMVNIMKKSGMQPDGDRLKHELVNNSPVDILYFAKFNNE